MSDIFTQLFFSYIFQTNQLPLRNRSIQPWAPDTIKFKHAKVLTVWTWQLIYKQHRSCISITNNKVRNKLKFHCFVPNISLAGVENVGIYCFSSVMVLPSDWFSLGSLSTRTFEGDAAVIERLRLGRGLLRMRYPGLPTLCCRRRRELSWFGGVVKVVSDLSGS